MKTRQVREFDRVRISDTDKTGTLVDLSYDRDGNSICVVELDGIEERGHLVYCRLYDLERIDNA